MSRLSRRELLRDGAVAGATVSLYASPAAAFAAKRRRRNGRSVAILGGGMAGLAAAHELAERGFNVTVYERKALGGKARSIGKAGTGTGGRRDLPGEHGFRFFPGFYHHVPDTMRRIPFAANRNGVWDNLVDAPESRSPRTDGRADSQVFGFIPDPQEAFTPEGMQALITKELVEQRGIRPEEGEFFANRVVVFMTSSDDRRFGQWEHTSWWDYVRAEGKSPEYQKVAARGLTRALVAAKEEVASTRTIGHMAEAFVWNIAGRGNDGALDRVLNGPTNESWIDPWLLHLGKLGVKFRVGYGVDRLLVSRDGRIAGAEARTRKGRRRIEADWFITAMPVEKARRLLSPKVLALDPSLAGMNELFVDWMNGIQYYLRRRVDLCHGHLTFPDSTWAVTALTQAQFWSRNDFARDYGDGHAVDSLSVDISDWDSPGMFNKKPAKECTAEEIAREVWLQIKAHLEDRGESVLPDDILHSWHLDPAIRWDRKRRRNSNDDPLLVNTIGSWEKRPAAKTKIRNFFVAGDYVKTDIDLATMEGGNESGRAAVNALLDASGSKEPKVQMFKLFVAPEFEPFKAADAELYRQGRPNAFDRP